MNAPCSPCHPRQLSLVREVSADAGPGQPVVFARSVFPISSLAGSLAHLRRLQSKSSLGAILFTHPGMHRAALSNWLAWPGDSHYLPVALRQAAAGLGPPLSRFEIEGKALMVSEVFLAALQPRGL